MEREREILSCAFVQLKEYGRIKGHRLICCRHPSISQIILALGSFSYGFKLLLSHINLLINYSFLYQTKSLSRGLPSLHSDAFVEECGCFNDPCENDLGPLST
jgi:hypothetical protein